MSGELEAAGALTTAGLVAGAVEGRPPGAAGEGACLNCGAQLTGRYCAECGQAAHAHRTMAHVFGELLHGLFHFDTKVWRTLPMLVGRPGTLTRNYVYGKRARYVSPLAMFLLTIFAMFFVFSSLDVDIFNVNTTPQDRAEVEQELSELRGALSEREASFAAERAARGGAALTPAQRAQDAAQDRTIALMREGVRRLEARLVRVEVVESIATEGAAQPAAAQGAPGVEAAPAAPEEQPRTWQEEVSEAARNGDLKANTGFPTLDARIRQSFENPDLALYKIQEAASTFAFLLVPISLPFIWLLFLWKRGVTLYDHVAFVLYGLSFASLIFVFLALCSLVPSLEPVGAFAFGLGMPAHMFFHLKGAYALGWWSTIWRTTLLLLFSLLSLMIYIVTIVMLGLGG